MQSSRSLAILDFLKRGRFCDKDMPVGGRLELFLDSAIKTL